MQDRLQRGKPPNRPSQAVLGLFIAKPRRAYTRSPPFRPITLLQYEHMFLSSHTASHPTRRLTNALRLARAFLLLEDEYEVDRELDPVDWEVDRQERCATRSRRNNDDRPNWEEPVVRREHPHRVTARLQPRPRRPGVPAPHESVCLCPITREQHHNS